MSWIERTRDMTDNDVAALLILVLFGGGIALAIVKRVFAHHERLEMIRHGVVPPPEGRRRQDTMEWANWAERSASCWGIDAATANRRQLHRGIMLTFIGLALTIGLSFIGYHAGEGPLGLPSITPGPWLLGGLVPLFVGLAQVVTALLSAPASTAPRFGQQQPSNVSTPPTPETTPRWGSRVNQVLDPEREIPPPVQPPRPRPPDEPPGPGFT